MPVIKVYKLESPSTEKVYIGSTSKSLCKRLADHKYDYKRYQAGKYNYVSSFEIIKLPDAGIMLLEQFEESEEKQKRVVEQYYLDHYKGITCNVRRAIRA